MKQLHTILDEVSTYEIAKSGLARSLYNYFLTPIDREGNLVKNYIEINLHFLFIVSVEIASLVLHWSFLRYVRLSSSDGNVCSL